MQFATRFICVWSFWSLIASAKVFLYQYQPQSGGRCRITSVIVFDQTLSIFEGFYLIIKFLTTLYESNRLTYAAFRPVCESLAEEALACREAISCSVLVCVAEFGLPKVLVEIFC